MVPNKKVLLGSQLSEEQEKTLIRFLFNNKDVFSWSANDHTLGFGSTFTIAGPGWPEGSISLLEVLVWNFIEARRLNILTFL
jgi:hypothetical protein